MAVRAIRLRSDWSLGVRCEACRQPSATLCARTGAVSAMRRAIGPTPNVIVRTGTGSSLEDSMPEEFNGLMEARSIQPTAGADRSTANGGTWCVQRSGCSCRSSSSRRGRR